MIPLPKLTRVYLLGYCVLAWEGVGAAVRNPRAFARLVWGFLTDWETHR